MSRKAQKMKAEKKTKRRSVHKKKKYTESDIEQLVRDKQRDDFQQYANEYGKERNYKSVWFWCGPHKIQNFEQRSPFKLGSIVKLTKCCFVTKAAIGGQGTWGDVWSACDAVIRNGLIFSPHDVKLYIEDLHQDAEDKNVLHLFVS